jgi:DNA-binding NarL/FixJ family response regulator
MEVETITKILLVDDHQMFIDGLKLVLRKVGNMKVVDEANSGVQALETIKKQKIDIVVTDIHMPEMSGTDLAKTIKRDYPEVKVLVVTSYCDGEIIREIFESEAEGYILKNAGKQELIAALNKIISGGIYYSNEVTTVMMGKMLTEKKHDEQLKNLTERELEILKLICKEYSTNEIATELFISPLTVETHRKHILHKTNSKSIVGLVKFAISNNII